MQFFYIIFAVLMKYENRNLFLAQNRMVPLGRAIFHLGTKFGAKMLIDAEIMALN